jgi:hypothetical protein
MWRMTRADSREEPHEIEQARLAGGAIFSLLLLTTPVAGTTGGDTFAGKSVAMIIGFGPGGGYDLWGRTVGRHIGRHLPGAPTVIPQNMPGAGSYAAGELHLQHRPEGRQRARHHCARCSARAALRRDRRALRSDQAVVDRDAHQGNERVRRLSHLAGQIGARTCTTSS